MSVDNSNFPRDGRVLKLYFKKYNSDQKKAFGPQLIALSVYEDIMKPSLYAEFLIRDFGNLLQSWSDTASEGSLATEGDESIFITVADPVNTHEQRNYEFGVISVTNSSSNPTELGQVYVIRAVSMEHLKNTQKLVAKSYEDKIENIVEDIVKNFLKSKKTVTKDDSTKDTVQLTIPTLNSFKSIDMLRKRAVSTQYPNSPYLFYETANGYNFATIDYIVENSKKRTVVKYTTKTAIESDFDDNTAKAQYKNMINHEIVKNFNTFEKVSSGALAINVKTFNITTKKFESNVKNVKNAKLPATTDEKGVLFKENLYQTFPDAGQYVFLPTSADVKTTIAENAGDKQISAGLFADTGIVFKAAGDLTTFVGEIIQIDIPSRDDAAKTNTFEFKLDEKYSGNYLITKIRHMFSLDEHDMVIEAVKIGKKK